MTNLQYCQHIDTDGTACPSKPYLSCPHCQLQICLKHVNLHQEYLQMDFMRLCDEINQTRWTLDHLTFDPSHQRDHLIKALDQWYEEEIRLTEKLYREKRKQIEILYIKSQMQFDIYKCQKEKQFCDNLQKHVKQVLHQEQIHRDDLDQLRSKLNSIRRGLEELQHLNIQIECDPSQRNINILQKPYIEAAKSLFDDDDYQLWKSNYDDDQFINRSEPSSIITVSSPSSSVNVSSLRNTDHQLIHRFQNHFRTDCSSKTPVLKRLRSPPRTLLLKSS